MALTMPLRLFMLSLMLALMTVLMTPERGFAQCEATASVNGQPFNDTTQCGPIQINFSDSLSTGVASRIWDFGDGSPNLSTNNPRYSYDAVLNDTTYTGTLTIVCSDGQTSVDSFDVTVKGSPEVSFISSDQELCAITDTLRLQNTSEQSSSIYYRWDFDNGDLTTFNQSVNDTSVIYTDADDYDVELVAVDSNSGCNARTTETITVNATPNAQFQILNSPSGCRPYRLDVNNTTPDVAVNISWVWDWGDGTRSTQEEPGGHLYDTTDTFTVRLTASTAVTQCTNFSTGEVTVKPKPDPTFEVSATRQNPVCPGDTVKLFFTGDDRGQMATYTWDLGNFQDSIQYTPQGDSIGVIFGNQEPERNVSLTVKIDSCDSTAEATAFLFPLPQVQLNNPGGDNEICANEEITFTTFPVGEDEYIFLLDGDTISQGSENDVAIDTLTQDAQLVVAVRSGPNDCAGRDTFDIVVNPLPELLITRITPGDTVCENSSLQFRALPDGLVNYTFFERFVPFANGPGDVASLTVDDDSAVVYVEGEDANGCVGQSQRLIIPIKEPTPAPQINCGTTDSNNIEFIWNQVPGATGYEISVDGGTFKNPSSGATGTSHQIDSLTLADEPISLRVRALGNPFCGPSEISQARTCATTPVQCDPITFDILNDTLLCAGDSATFEITNLSTDSFAVNWANTGFVDSLVEFRTAFTDDDTLRVEVADSTQDPRCATAFRFVDIEVPGGTINSFTSRNTINDTICREQSIQLSVSPRGFDRYTFLTPDSVILQESGNPELTLDTLTRTQTFVVQAQLDGCFIQPDTLQIGVTPDPVLSLSTNTQNDNACPGDDVVVRAAPDTLATYSFFVNGFLEQQGALDSISVSGQTQGFDVQATAANRYGCRTQAFEVLSVEVRPRPQVALSTDLPNDTLCEGDSALLQASTGFTRYTFLNEDQPVATQGGSTFEVGEPANGPRFSVIAEDQFGCESDPSSKVLVRFIEVPEPQVIVSDDSICVGDQVTFSAELAQNPSDYAGLTYAWSNGATSAQQELTPTSTLQLQLTTANFQCGSDTVSGQTFVDATGVPALSVQVPDSVCVDEEVSLTAEGAENFSWSLVNGVGSTADFLSNPQVASPDFTASLADTPFVDFRIDGRNVVCSASTNVRVILDRCLEELPDEAIPQIITPNGDGVNDEWFIDAIGYSEFRNNSVQIINRWGQEVFSASPYNNNWRGQNNNGNDLPDGTYFYVVDLGNGSVSEGFVIINR